MKWDGQKIRGLRLRMGWSQSDLARRLHIESAKIGQFEMDLEPPTQALSQTLELLVKQADVSANGVSCGSLAEILFEDDDLVQVDTSSIQRKFLDQ